MRTPGKISFALGGAAALLCAAAGAAPAQAAPPAFYTYLKPLPTDLPGCIGAAEKAMTGAGVAYTAPAAGSPAIFGASGDTRVGTLCVRRPKDGYCHGDGYTFVVTAAGPQAGPLSQKIVTTLIPPKIIDCENDGFNGVPTEP